MAATIVFSAGPGISKIKDWELRQSIEVVGKEVGR
jgi:hypothetical protein